MVLAITRWHRTERAATGSRHRGGIVKESPYSLGFRTLEQEVSIDGLPVRGAVPPWLTGTLVRVGPAYNHWFDGLAMLHRFAFAAGRVSYANRYLRSRAYREATERGRISGREFATDPCQTLFQRVAAFFSPKLPDNCNVNVARLAGRIVALTETRLPIRFDPDTLETLGGFDYDARIKGPVSTAHPHHDRARGRHYSYLLEFGRRSRYDVPGAGPRGPAAPHPVRVPRGLPRGVSPSGPGVVPVPDGTSLLHLAGAIRSGSRHRTSGAGGVSRDIAAQSLRGAPGP
jgi:hypothetical protein